MKQPTPSAAKSLTNNWLPSTSLATNFMGIGITPGGLLTLNTRKGKPFGQCPDMVCQACGHGGCTLLPRSIGDSHTQCPYRPAEVITVQGEIGHRLMHVPVLREAVNLTHLTGVAVAVGAVFPFDKRGIDGLTHPPLCQG